jgi:hypothetical protein
MSFMRYKQQEYLKNKNVLLLVTRFRTFPLVELSLGWMLSSRAFLRFTQQTNVLFFNLTQFVEQTPLYLRFSKTSNRASL